MKIGIFGGCFNPPHKMHMEIAKHLISNYYLDKVVFVPTGNNYAKADLINIDERTKMLNMMIDDENIVVSDISKDLKYQYTFEVLDYYKSMYPTASIYFICGTDNLNEFDTWEKYEYILKKFKLLVINRNDDNIDDLLDRYSSFKDNIQIIKMTKNLVSSTMIRKCIKEQKFHELYEYVDKEILKYIQEKGLYKK